MITGLRRLAARWLSLLRTRALDRDLEAEWESHVAIAAEEKIRRGMSPAEARWAAKVELGSRASLASAHRDIRGIPVMSGSLRDARTAWRSFVGSRHHSFPVLLILALGIGVATAVFSVLDSTIWRRVPFANADRLVEVWNVFKGPQSFLAPGGTPDQVLAWRKQTDLFDWVEAYEPVAAVYQSPSTASLTDGALVTPSLFQRLGAVPALGELFTTTDGTDGAPAVVILSHSFWSRELGRDDSIVGKLITLDQVPHRIRGVMRPDFRFPDGTAELWRPVELHRTAGGSRRHDLDVGPRLVPIAMAKASTFADAERAVRRRGEAVNATAGSVPLSVNALNGRESIGAQLIAFGREASGESRRALQLLASAAGLLLLIVCVNVGALTVSRDLKRSRTAAIRSALGASRTALFRERLFEHLLTGLLGGVGALLVAYLMIHVVVTLPTSFAGLSTNPIDVDSRALVFALTAGLMVGLAFGGPAAWKTSAPSVQVVLQAGARGVSETLWSKRARWTLVATQISLSLVLLAAAGEVGQSVYRLHNADRGYEPRGLVRVRLGLPHQTYRDARRRDSFEGEVLEALRGVKGVRAAIGELPPWTSRILIGSLEIADGRGSDTGYLPRMRLFNVSPNYFATMGIPLLAGRSFREDDPPEVVLVSRRFADAHWAVDSAVGRTFRLGSGAWRTVIGVVEEVRQVTVETRGTSGPEQVYQRNGRGYEKDVGMSAPATSAIAEDRTVMVRVDEPSVSGRILTDRIAALDPMVVVRIDEVNQLIAQDIGRSRLVWALLSGFALCALFLSGIGLYGLMACAIEQRRLEFGIRVALGASPQSIGRRVINRALGLTLCACAAGLAAAVAFSRVLESELYGTSPVDPATLGAVTALLVGTAILAAWRPAARAARVNPVDLLRSE